MVIRCAYFEGFIHQGKEEEFWNVVETRLVPLWTKFPSAQSVRVFREVDAEDGSHRYPMILQIAYPSRQDVAIALNSQVRAISREETKRLLELFEGRVFHVIYEVDEYVPDPQPAPQ